MAIGGFSAGVVGSADCAMAIIVDAPKAMKKKREEDDTKKKLVKKPASGLAGWLEQLQAKAEELKKQADKGGK